MFKLISKATSWRVEGRVLTAASLSLFICLFCVCRSEAQGEKVLFIASNVSEMNGTPNGTYLMELAVPMQYFVKEGIAVDVLSPKGGPIAVYHKGDTTETLQGILQETYFPSKIAQSLSAAQVLAEDYGAVIIPGGYGQFWDVHLDEQIKALIVAIYESGGVIGSLGHGTSTLVPLRLSSGEYLVTGKTMTCFPYWNEKNIMKESNYGQLLPFDMQEALTEQGADLKIYDHASRTNHEIIDERHRLVTAAFASGGGFVAREVHRLMQKN